MNTTLFKSLLVAAALVLTTATTATASSSVIDTRDDATVTIIASFGVINTATYGQIVLAPNGADQITSFGFRIIPISGGPAVLRGEIYAWDGTKATGPSLYESEPRTLDVTGQQEVDFNTGSTPLTPGAQYVLFVTTSIDTEKQANSTNKFLTNTAESYPDGKFVFINNGPDEKQWTTNPWSSIATQNLQFHARFASATQPLTITKPGKGSGTVISGPGGLKCGATCTSSYPNNSLVALFATAETGSVFSGFSGGGCTGNPCILSLTDATSVAANFVDKKKPQTTITKRKGSKIYFTSNETKSTFKCSLDKSKAKKCKSPYKLKKLKKGKHTFKVYAIDKAGNKDSSPASLKITVK
jgi:hypothetical protein